MACRSFRLRTDGAGDVPSGRFRPVAFVALVALGCSHWACEEGPEPATPPAVAEEQPPPNPPPPPQQPPLDAPVPSSLPSAPPPQAAGAQAGVQAQPVPPPPATQPTSTDETAPPPAAQWVYSSANGHWVYTATYGWLWVPEGATTSVVDGVPYAYLYTPAYGWTWYISPWGPGAYRYGIWVRHPWFPTGWRGPWVAHPRIVVRLGGHGHRR